MTDRALQQYALAAWMLSGGSGGGQYVHPWIATGKTSDATADSVTTVCRFNARYKAVRFAASGRITFGSGVDISGAGSSGWAWIRTTSTDGTSGYAGNSALGIWGDFSNSVWHQFGIHGGKVRYTRFSGSAWQTVDSNTSVNDGRWRHVAWTYSSGSTKLFVDGILDKTQSITHTAAAGTNMIGAQYLNGSGSQDSFDGDMWGVGVANSMLADTDIRGLYIAGRRDLEAV